MRTRRVEIADAPLWPALAGRVLVAEGEIGARVESLEPEERDDLPSATPARLREYAMGRALARKLLAEIGAGHVAVTRAHDRSPRWPAGFAGSISHTSERCIVAVASTNDVASLGIDMEPAQELNRDVFETIASPCELREIESLPAERRAAAVHRLFVAKESVYKCLYPLCGRFLEFHDVEIAFELDGQRFQARSARAGRRIGDLRGVVQTREDALIALAAVPPWSRVRAA